MKKYITLLALAGMLLTAGCAAGNTATGSSNAIEKDPAETAYEPDIAFLTREAPTEQETPPQLMVTYSGSGIATAAAMTLGSSEWTYGGKTTETYVSAPLKAYADGLVTAVADLDLVSENEPQILLRDGAEITGAELYMLDSSDTMPLSYTPDGVLSFPNEVYNGVAAVSVSFEQGTAVYYFAVTRSQTDPSKPPELYLYSDGNDIGWRLTKGGYTWTVEQNGEAYSVAVDCPSPWQMFESNSVRDTMAEPGQTLTIGLPVNSRITSAVLYTSEDEYEPLSYSGNVVTTPDKDGACCITVEMPAGTCDYVFGLLTCGNSNAEGEPHDVGTGE